MEDKDLDSSSVSSFSSAHGRLLELGFDFPLPCPLEQFLQRKNYFVLPLIDKGLENLITS